MRALFGAGMHPLAAQRLQRLPDADLTESNVRAATRLGVPFKVVDIKPARFRVEVAKRIAACNEQAGLPLDWPVPPAERARIRTEVARELFAAEHGRPPADAREVAGTIAKHSRRGAQSVAGFDLTFSPVKSVSTLWAVAGPQVAAQIERAHQAAVGDALRFLEQHALFTREGSQGIRQVNVRGLVAAAFTHRDSRSGDPDLHTHVAVANKVQTLDGRWLSIDGVWAARRWAHEEMRGGPGVLSVDANALFSRRFDMGLGLVRLPHAGASDARCERGDRSSRVGAAPGLVEANQIGGQDCLAAVGFLELGIDEPDTFKVGSGDDAEADAVEFGRQARLQVDLGAFVDDRRRPHRYR